jgi:3-keto-L-gulonate-6-phosphate decarboxylase
LVQDDKVISVNGGIPLDNLKIFSDLKVDYICVGSRIFLRGDPKENYRQFTEALAKLELGLLK